MPTQHHNGTSRDGRAQQKEDRQQLPSAEARNPRQTARAKHGPGLGTSRSISAIVAGLFLPGGGHFRIGRPARGAIYLLGFILAGVITFLSVPFQTQLPLSMRGYSDGMASLYQTLSFLVSRKVIYTLVALCVAQAASVIDLVILIIIGDRPSKLPESRQ
ncbi:MAG TPA: hypothetical protein VM163_10915 [bacterium]|nr:hypothetical protein [bacterium]